MSEHPTSTMPATRRLLPALALVLWTWPAAAEVRHVAPDGFLVVHEVSMAAPPAAVYDALGRVRQWWSDAHTWFGSAANLSMELRAGGCFCERSGEASVEHGRVVFARPGQLVRLQALLGPLQEMGVSGTLSFALAVDGEGTRITASYRVSGDTAHGFDRIAPLVDGVIGEQVQRLKRLLESGAPR
jgi:uncharacterized protein YndB with AHSA1/START domain